VTGLRHQQQALRSAVLSAKCPDELLAPGRSPLEARFAIYANAYRGRMRAALRDNYPVLAAVIGDEAFATLGEAYLLAHPSSHPSIRWFGDALHDFVTRRPDHLPHPALAELVLMEWGLRHAFDAADQAPMTRDALAACPPEHWPGLRFALHPTVTMLTLEWGIEPLWHRLSEDPEADCSPPEREPHELLIWRQGLATRFRGVASNEATLLRAMAAGATLGTAGEATFPGAAPEVAAPQLLALLVTLLDEGVLIHRQG